MTKISPRDGARPIRRTDNPVIVTQRGKVARLESGLTPHEAQIEDLVFLRKVLKKANVPFLLVRDHKNRPVLAVDIEPRSAVERELTTACATEPMYAKTVDTPGLSPILMAEGRLSMFRYGPRFGVELHGGADRNNAGNRQTLRVQVAV